MPSTCSHCVAAGKDPKGVTWDDAETFNKHLAKHHGPKEDDQSEKTEPEDQDKEPTPGHHEDAAHHRARKK